ncbi:MAG: GldG family protein [Candidatus Wallbacteria bacterium]|nr:GldG family protein [Candidatus Wallbacteria bacterium]
MTHQSPLRNFLRTLARATCVAGALALVAGINWVATRENRRFDLTARKVHSLGEKTLQILRGLKSPISITALYPGVAPEAVADLLGEFRRAAGGIVTTEIVDPLQNLGYAAQFGNRIDAQERRVVIQAGKAREEIDCTETPLDEGRLASAIYRAVTESSTVYFLRGHNEYEFESPEPDGLSRLATSLRDLQFKVEGLGLAGAGAKVPDDCRVLVIAGARTTPSDEEKKEISRYLDDGGHALFLVESAIRTPSGTLTEQEQRANPTWNDVLSRWGVTMGDNVAVDISNHMGQDIGCPATSKYPDHDKIVKGLGITFYVRPRSISFVKPSDRQVLFAPLVQTVSGETSWAETDRTLYVHFDEGQDLRGPVTIGSVLLQDPKTWKDGKSTKLVVLGDADFVTNQYTNRYSNLDLVVNSIAWLAQREMLAPAEKTGTPEQRLEMTAGDIKLAVGGIAVFPVLVMLFGLNVWLRRKK